MKKSAQGSGSIFQKFTFGVKAVLLAETVALVGSYFLWRKMNRDREFRYKIYQTSPYLLEYYYTIGEKLGGQSAREADYTVWGIK